MVSEFDELHRRVLPDRLRTPIGAAAARDVRSAEPLVFRLTDGRAYRFRPEEDTIRIEPGDDAAALFELDEPAWRDFVTEMATGAGLFYGNRIQVVRGALGDLERWEPALRLLLSGRPIFDPEQVEFRGRDGLRLDLGREFDLDSPDEELRHFLHTTGFLLVRRVFSGDEIARLIERVAERQALARPGDGRSWWARRADGASVLCRLIYLGLVEPAIAALSDEPRIRRLAALAGEPLRPCLDRSDGHSVVLKNADVTEGLSDLPWHRDCGLGGHPVTCPALNIGVQLDAATADSGRLHFVPGSWGASCHRHALERAATIAVDTEPGDCTVHFGDTLHAAPPPTGSGPGRRALYVSCMPARAADFIPPGKSYNDVILARFGH